jgi:hypothetical protein
LPFGDPTGPPVRASTFSVLPANNPDDDPDPSLLDVTFGSAPNAIPTRSGVVRALIPSLVVVEPEPSAGCAGLEVCWDMSRGNIPGTVS